ncbi:MAG: thiamine pyrophosphate-dependent enzyme [Candidatus Hydrothermales bacterium]
MEVQVKKEVKHRLSRWIREERWPHIWCSGCGLGIAMSSMLYAFEELNLDPKEIAIVSGIGCTGRVAGYVKVDSYHTTHGRPIPFAIGLKIAKPEMKVIVFSGDGDIIAIGGNHFIHAARRNFDLICICVNNFNYGMTGGQFGPTTPYKAKTTTTPYGNFEYPFNLPYLAASAGATFVARWTCLHAYHLRQSIKKALQRKGFSFIEIISPCPTGFGRPNKIGEGLDEMKYYKEKSIIKNGIDPKDAELSLMGGNIVVGEFVDINKPSYLEILMENNERIRREEK